MDQPGQTREPASPEKGRGSTSKIANSLVALSSAAVLTVYAAGYVRTRSAAARFAVVEAAADRRTDVPTAAPPPAAPPRDVVDARRAEPAASAQKSAVPRSDANVSRSGIASPEPSPVQAADSTPSAPGAAPAEQPTAPPPLALITDPAPADADSVKAEAPAPPAARESKFKDGTYKGWGYSRHGDIEAAVVIQDGRVVSAEITQCLTRYSCSVIDTLPPQVLSRQNAFVDLISGATESANAYSNAIFRALVASQK